MNTSRTQDKPYEYAAPLWHYGNVTPLYVPETYRQRVIRWLDNHWLLAAGVAVGIACAVRWLA